MQSDPHACQKRGSVQAGQIPFLLFLAQKPLPFKKKTRVKSQDIMASPGDFDNLEICFSEISKITLRMNLIESRNLETKYLAKYTRDFRAS